MGDSITEGQFVNPPYRWVDIIADDIVRDYINETVMPLFVTSGVSGETTRQGLERFPSAVQEHQPDIVTIQFGLNDCNCWSTDYGLPRVSLNAYRANLIEMIERSRSFGASHIILSNNHPTLRHKILLGGKTLEEMRKIYNETLKEVANETGVMFTDINSTFQQFNEKELETQLLPYPDWLHLSHAGHERYAAKIKPLIETSIQEICRDRGIVMTNKKETT